MHVDSLTALTVPTINFLSFLSPNEIYMIKLFIPIQRVFVRDFGASIHRCKLVDCSNYKWSEKQGNSCETRVVNPRVLNFLKISNEVLFRNKNQEKEFNTTFRCCLEIITKRQDRKNLLNWFISYLSCRKQKVMIEGVHSDCRSIEAGVH